MLISIGLILQPIIRLRQACCHPQAVRGQFMSLQKKTMTMEQLLEQLISKAKNEAEEAHRLYIAALNGLAGIEIIQVDISPGEDAGHCLYLRSVGQRRQRSTGRC